LFVTVLALVFSTSGSAQSAEPSEPAPLAAKSLLLAVARAGARLVAVGDRGHVVVSDDNGLTWTQRLTPTRAMLTGVSFPDAQHGWAVGHDGVILATTDGGQTWTREDSGADLETVYLDVLFLDTRRGLAVGAYGKFVRTTDGGRTWQPAKPADDEVHYNCIAAGSQGSLYLAGESGTLLISGDNGQTWRKSDVPYDGSLFTVVPAGDQALIVAGLRGHILTSTNHGATWEPHDSAVPVLIMGGTTLRGGTIVLAGLGGNFFISRDRGSSFNDWKPAGFGTGVADLIETSDGALVVVGEAGAARLNPPESPPRAGNP
jgi:photosystem II stability/assembly factor-like uncharacterized protein